ncbi:hypothetical protein I3842_16G082900 [Carya illinoinensis]|uniref:Uncharacterized protein n=1 Tax=Carya illinoinensis TaxID=32201 RepID=A0A922A163_CARIL|nr:hypothetical protein I3842_16G082900 [Carya illinoinensis]
MPKTKQPTTSSTLNHNSLCQANPPQATQSNRKNHLERQPLISHCVFQPLHRMVAPSTTTCFIVSTVNALQTPMINASMVLCDMHFGGINYLVGGIAKFLAKGLIDQGSEIISL